MGDQSVVLAVASYATRAAAERDLDCLWSSESLSRSDYLSGALVEKGTSGELEIDCHRSRPDDRAWGLALLGGALTALAAPVGVTYLASGFSSREEWAGAAAVVGRFWNHIPRDKLRSMSNLLEAGQVGLVVVAVAPDSDDVTGCLSGDSSRVLSESILVDPVADFRRAAGQT
jgi:hypothetical protein